MDSSARPTSQHHLSARRRPTSIVSDKTVASDDCFEIFGYCINGNGVLSQCPPADVKCGMLYCIERNMGDDMICRPNLSKDNAGYEMVEPGTKCGDGMVCSNGHCVDVQTAY